MKTIVLCVKCKQELHIVDVRPAWTMNEVEIEVEICQNPDCYEGGDEVNCSNCEDLKLWQKRAEVAEAKLKTIKEFFTSNKAETSEDKNFEPKLDTNIKDLPATKDIVSTGGAIIPGIKEGSADGVVAEYGKDKP